MASLQETTWTNEHGEHLEMRQVAEDGSVHAVIITRHPYLGWLGIEEARRKVRASAEAGRQALAEEARDA